MKESLENYFKNKDNQTRAWIHSIALSPVTFCALWVIFYSLVALYHAAINMHFGHGSEVLLALPIAILVIAVQVSLTRKLIRTFANKNL